MWHYPIAQLSSILANALGGKPDKNKPAKNPVPEHLLYTPEDFLPWYAKFDFTEAWTPDALSDVAEHSKQLPSWAMQLIPWGRVTL